jgi:predicted dehydrogenase
MTRIGVIGIGRWGKILISAFSKVADVVACGSTGGLAGREWLAREYPSVAWAPDGSAILQKAEVDAVIIATPIATHEDLTERGLWAGKHCWVEKPLALSGARADFLADLADRRDLILFVGHTFLFDPAYMELRRLTRQDAVQAAKLTWRKIGLFEAPLLWNLLPHDIAICLDLFGELPTSMTASFGPEGIDSDYVDVEMSFSGGRSAAIRAQRSCASSLKRIDVTTRGGARYVWRDGTLGSVAEGHELALVAKDARVDAVSVEVRSFLDSVERGVRPGSDGRLGATVTQLLEGIKPAAAPK